MFSDSVTVAVPLSSVRVRIPVPVVLTASTLIANSKEASASGFPAAASSAAKVISLGSTAEPT